MKIIRQVVSLSVPIFIVLVMICLVLMVTGCSTVPIKAEKSANLIHYKYEFGTKQHSIGGKVIYYWNKVRDEAKE